MAIYNLHGEQLTAVYNLSGEELDHAFNISGDLIYSKSAPIPSIRLKVMEYNVGQWYDGTASAIPAEKQAAYYELQNGMISRADPDVLLLCEYSDTLVDGTTAVQMLGQYFPYIHRVPISEASSYSARAICSKYPISNYTKHVFENNSNNYYDEATITVDGTPITVIVTHLSPHSNAERWAQFQVLMSFLQTKETFICGGDFNTLDCTAVTGVDYENMIWPMIRAGFGVANCADFGFIHTYSDQPLASWTGCLDNIVTSANFTVLSAIRDDAKLSNSAVEKTDHMPLIAVLET